MDKLRVITYSSYLTRCPDGVKFASATVGIVFALQSFNTIPLTRIVMLHLYDVGGILFQYLACPSEGDSDLRNRVSITKPLVYHSFHFYTSKEAPIPFGNTTIGFSSSPRF